MKKKFSDLSALKDMKLPGAKPSLVEQAKAALREGKKGRIAPAAPRPKKAEPLPEPEDAATDAALFRSAMQGVDELSGTGRSVQPAPPPPPPQDDADDAEARLMRQAMVGSVEFELESSDEYMHGYVRGLDSRIFQQLKAGRFSPEGHLDLHGQNADQALDALLFFMRESYLAGRRMVLVIPGRGKNSPHGLGVLRQELQGWLTREPLRRIVLAFCTAQPKDGGAGALYVLLRRVKKQQGKVAWDKQINWEEIGREPR